MKKFRAAFVALVVTGVVLAVVVIVLVVRNGWAPKAGSGASKPGGSSLADRAQEAGRALPGDSDFPPNWIIERSVPTAASSLLSPQSSFETKSAVDSGLKVTPADCAVLLGGNGGPDLGQIDPMATTASVIARPQSKDPTGLGSVVSINAEVTVARDGQSPLAVLGGLVRRCPAVHAESVAPQPSFAISMDVNAVETPIPKVAADQAASFQVEFKTNTVTDGQADSSTHRSHVFFAQLRGVLLVIGSESGAHEAPGQDELTQKLFAQTVQRLHDLP